MRDENMKIASANILIQLLTFTKDIREAVQCLRVNTDVLVAIMNFI